jgi:hypothetical protein
LHTARARNTTKPRVKRGVLEPCRPTAAAGRRAVWQ